MTQPEPHTAHDTIACYLSKTGMPRAWRIPRHIDELLTIETGESHPGAIVYLSPEQAIAARDALDSAIQQSTAEAEFKLTRGGNQ